MKRLSALSYGVVCYAIFFSIFLYTIGFLGGFIVPKTIDSGAPGPWLQSALVNVALLTVFALQHSVMARPGFKAWWTRVVPHSVERSTYVLATCAALVLIYSQWRPMPATVWHFEGAVGGILTGVFFLGIGTVLYSTFLIDHFDLFGLRQVVLRWKGTAYTEKRFVTPQAYRFIRHPLYVGWFITFWATPHMSVGHLLFAVVGSAYILAAIPLEERDLSKILGEGYRSYRSRTPRFVPNLGSRANSAVSPTAVQSS